MIVHRDWVHRSSKVHMEVAFVEEHPVDEQQPGGRGLDDGCQILSGATGEKGGKKIALGDGGMARKPICSTTDLNPFKPKFRPPAPPFSVSILFSHRPAWASICQPRLPESR